MKKTQQEQEHKQERKQKNKRNQQNQQRAMNEIMNESIEQKKNEILIRKRTRTAKSSIFLRNDTLFFTIRTHGISRRSSNIIRITYTSTIRMSQFGDRLGTVLQMS